MLRRNMSKFLCLFLLLPTVLWGAVAPYTERGTTDFDTFLNHLNPYGTWQEIQPELWRYYPLAGEATRPYSQGRWVYSDFGWFWVSARPYGWATDHYGAWIRGPDGRWGWQPDPYWHPHTVDFRQTKTHIGWRPSRYGQLHELLEKEEARFAQPEEWLFVTREAFKGPITPAIIVTGEAAQKLLEESEPCGHTFISWREMDRLGPDPINYVPKEWVKNPDTLRENEPEILVATLWSLPTYWTPRPREAKPEDLYVYRPKFFQDADGLQRRVLLWNRPPERKKALDKVHQVLQTPAAPVIDAPAPAPALPPPSPPAALPQETPPKATPSSERWKSKP
jgi:hypothetical protein